MLQKQEVFKVIHKFKIIKAKNNNKNKKIKDHNQLLIIEQQKVKKKMDNRKLVMIKKQKIPRKNKIKKYKFNLNQNLKLMIN